jgi:UDP-N-acetylmuramoylalanine--D-glutamate ligase
MMDLSGKKRFFVLGLGRSGKAVARLLTGKGFEVVAFDDNPSAVAEFRDTPGLDKIDVVSGDDVLRRLAGSDGVVVSPGVALEHPVIRRAKAGGIPVLGELEVAYHYASAPILAVTGTNGKSTTVSLIGNILKAAKKRHVVAGNIGMPFSSVVGERQALDVIVLEVSSFQLDTLDDFKADVAVLLNVTADHLDRYSNSFDVYADSKSRILNRADMDTWFVYNDGDAICRELASDFAGRKISFGSEGRSGDRVYVRDGVITRAWRGHAQPVLALAEYSPVGIHNLENAMAAVASVMPFEVDVRDVAKALKTYRPLPHRMELAGVVDGVAYVDDSKATNVDATVKSVRSIEGSIVLIMGGVDKGGDYDPLIEHLGRVRRVILIGQAADKIEKTFRGRCEISRAGGMEDAVRDARKAASSGDTVLLAPACSSFDMFRDYAARGDAFKSAVASLQR